MEKFLNVESFSYDCCNGIKFSAKRCDFREGVTATIPSGLPLEKVMADVAEMIGYHAAYIYPKLYGFNGYNCISFSQRS